MGTRTYIPIQALPMSQVEGNAIVDYISRFHDRGAGYGGENAFKYMIGELTTNIYEHSGFENAFVMAQKYEKKGFMEIAFFDDGLTIPGTLKRAGFTVGEDYAAIMKAMNGLSSKKSVERGYGLYSNARLCTHGLAGRIFIASGNGALEYTATSQKTYIPTAYNLQKAEYSLNGTIVSLRIPYPSPDVNLYDFTN